MIHSNRRFCVNPQMPASEAFEWLARNNTVCCSGFQFGKKTLWLNDAFSEDGAQEYAVYRIVQDSRDSEGNGSVQAMQIESITCSWTDRDTLKKLVNESQAEDWQPLHKPEILQLEFRGHSCGLCE